MSLSSRSAVAVHILGMLAFTPNEYVTSETIAASVRTNPVVIRRLLGAMREAKLVTLQTGAKGGSRLARNPQEITVLEIYRAVEHHSLFALPEQKADPSCVVGAHVQDVMDEVFDAAQAAMEAILAKTTLAEVMHSVIARANPACEPSAHSTCEPQPNLAYERSA